MLLVYYQYKEKLHTHSHKYMHVPQNIAKKKKEKLDEQNIIQAAAYTYKL